MKTKRPTPHKLPSGRWNVQVRVGDKRISVTDDDKDVCQAKAMAIQAGVIKREEEKPTKITLESAINEYIKSKSNTLSPSTVRGYEFIKKKRFRGIMKRDIYKLTKQDIQVAVNQEAKDVSPKTIANAYGLIRPVLKDYGIDVFGVKLPQKQPKPKSYIQPEEIEKLLQAAREDKYEVAILFAIWLGLRRSEICGMCWDCIDFKKKTITVKRTLLMNKDGECVLEDRTKTTKSNRTLPCPDYILDRLSAMRNGRTEGRIFTFHPNTLVHHIHKVCAAAGITDTTVHGLRHTNAAVMRYLGVSDAYAMERGGWTEERTYKNIYSYVFDSTANKEGQIIDDFFDSKAQNVR